MPNLRANQEQKQRFLAAKTSFAAFAFLSVLPLDLKAEAQVRSRRPRDRVQDPARREPRWRKCGEVTGTEVHCSSDWGFDRNITPPLPIADLPSLPRLALHHKDAQTPWSGRTWPPGAPGWWESPRWSLCRPQTLPSQFRLGGAAITQK